MFVHDINPVLFSVAGFEIRYYALAYILGALIAIFMLPGLAKEKGLNFSKKDATDFVSYLLLAVIIGARIFYIIFYNLDFYLSSPIEMFKLWHGGLSFHGGLVGAILFSYFYCKKKRMDFYDLADISVIPLCIGLFLGRIGNFINGELYGKITSLPWAVKFKSVEGFRHPSQIYEAVKNLVIFGVLFSVRKKPLQKGVLFWLFIALYGSMRFIIEFFRQPDAPLIVGLSRGQFFCAIMAFIGIAMLIKKVKHNL